MFSILSLCQTGAKWGEDDSQRLVAYNAFTSVNLFYDLLFILYFITKTFAVSFAPIYLSSCREKIKNKSGKVANQPVHFDNPEYIN
jgi:hypothetical protein